MPKDGEVAFAMRHRTPASQRPKEVNMFFRRLYFIIPDETQAAQVVHDLETAGVSVQHIHAVAGRGITLTRLPPATERHRKDAGSRLERLAWSGNLALFALAAVGLIASLAGSSLVGGTLSVVSMMVTLAAGSLFALRVPDTHLDEFRGALSHGDVLLMVDVPKRRVAEIEELINRRHHEATPGGVGWTIEALGI
jgi:hypothetical protein